MATISLYIQMFTVLLSMTSKSGMEAMFMLQKFYNKITNKNPQLLSQKHLVLCYLWYILSKYFEYDLPSLLK